MRKYKLNPRSFDKFIYQNKAELIDFYEGCLLDNYLYQTKRGVMAIYEQYVNCWTSEFLVIFASDEKEISQIWCEFDNNRKEEEEQTA